MRVIDVATGKFYAGFESHRCKPIFTTRGTDAMDISESEAEAVVRQLNLLGYNARKEYEETV